jgi:quercetin dioxygenase-like cupin family protein
MKNLTQMITGALFAAAILAITVIPVTGQDPVKVDAKHYKVELENDQVRVVRVNYGVKEKSVMHQHPEGVVIALTDTQTKFTLADGKTEERGFKAGETMWAPAGTHLPENLGGKPMEVILVELKDGTGGGPMPAAADDPVKVAAKHHKVEFENERVRVLRAAIGPREKSAMHAHPANVVIFLTDARVQSTMDGGKSEELQGKAGQVTWRDPLKHDTENLSDKPLEVILVELKGK